MAELSRRGLLAAGLTTRGAAGGPHAPGQNGGESPAGGEARVGSAGNATFSPDGGALAFITNLSGTPQLWTMPSAGGYPTQVTGFDDPVTAALWSPTQPLIAISVAPGGGLNEQLYLVSPDGSGLR